MSKVFHYNIWHVLSLTNHLTVSSNSLPTWKVWCISGLKVSTAPFSSQFGGLRNSRVEAAILTSSVWYEMCILSSATWKIISAISSFAGLFLFLWNFWIIFWKTHQVYTQRRITLKKTIWFRKNMCKTMYQ